MMMTERSTSYTCLCVYESHLTVWHGNKTMKVRCDIRKIKTEKFVHEGYAHLINECFAFIFLKKNFTLDR